MAIERIYYALSDSFTGDNPKELTSGLAQRKEVIGFRDWEDRARWVRETNLQTARILTRPEAAKLTPYDTHLTDQDYHIKSIRIYGESGFFILKKMARKARLAK
jgi:hypothetical protein